MKIKFGLLIILSFGLLISSEKVFALDKNINAVYKNINNVTLTQKEYKFVNEFYGDGFFDTMTQEQYNWISNLDINNRKVKIVSLDENQYNKLNYFPNSDNHNTSSKKLKIVKACSKDGCTIDTMLEWLINPSIRSFDVMGVRVDNTSINVDTIKTKVSSSKGTFWPKDNMIVSDGFGTTINLSNTGNNITIEQQFTTSKGGKIHASYQHAKRNVSLATSKQYRISAQGAGSVFDFYGNATGIYDNMGGVDIEL